MHVTIGAGLSSAAHETRSRNGSAIALKYK